MLLAAFTLIVAATTSLSPVIAETHSALPSEVATALQAAVDSARLADGVTGTAAAVSFHDGTLWTGASGLDDVAAEEPMSPDGLFRIASVTKTYVAALVLLLQEEGRLSIDDPVDRWLPGLLPRGNEISLRHLLSHRSGLFDYTSDAESLQAATTAGGDLGHAWTADEIIAIVNHHGMVFEPGTDFEWSNANYYLLGMVIEAVTGESLAEVLRARLLEPHGLRHTYLPGPDGQPDVVHNYSSNGLDWADLQATSLVTYLWSAGAMVATPADMVRWAQRLFGGQVLRASSVQDMLPQPGASYGLGIMPFVTPLGPGVGHGGSLPTFRSQVTYLARAGVTIAEAVNGGNIPTTTEQLARRLAQLLPGYPSLFPDVPRQDVILLDEQATIPSEGSNGARPLQMSGDQPVLAGTRSAAIVASPASFTGWRLQASLPGAIDAFGFAILHFAVHPGTATGSSLSLQLGDASLPLTGRRSNPAYRVDLERQEWQVFEIPASLVLGVSYADTLTGFGFFGNLDGTFYVDDVRLIAPAPAVTAVIESGSSSTAPSVPGLRSIYPNPFNGVSTIAIDLDVSTEIDLSIYSLTGQRLVTLAGGTRSAGSHIFHWDGRDGVGRAVATGVYLCRLRTASAERTRRLTLLR